jgi:LacI family transcriptional regulator
MTRVLLRDVARRAGVSPSTASLVLNGKTASIGPETSSRVEQAAIDLGYRPNVLARSLRSQRSRTIGFLSNEVVTTPYAGEMIHGAQDVANEHDFVLLLGNVSGDRKMERRTIEAFLDRRVDVLIYATMYHRAVEVPAGIGGLPIVFLDAQPPTPAHSSVVPDEYGGATLAVEHLVAQGHRHIAYLDDVARPIASIERRRAYVDAMRAHGLTPDADVSCASTSVDAIDAALSLLGRDTPPTALFCFNDRIAAGAYTAARRLGLDIPGDLSIVGFDNQVLVAEAIDPGLTTVQLPHYEMGRWATEQALALLDEKSTAPVAKQMPCLLVERGSVAPPGNR